MKKLIISFLTVLSVLSCLAFAFADEAVINDAESTYHNNGDTVFNNMGTVYNNEGTVYNNGGTVYLNGGLAYNNGGTVYLNGGTVYNNGGEVYVNGDRGVLYDIQSEQQPMQTQAEKTPEKPSGYEISLSGDYEPFVYIDGFVKRGGKLYIDANGSAVIRVKPGVTLVNSYSTTGRCTLQSDGSIVFGNADSDGTLTLKFRLDDPIITPDFGPYGEKQQVRIIAAECARVYYTLDGSEPDKNSMLYSGPFELEDTCIVNAAAFADGADGGRTSGTYIFPKITVPVFKTVNAGYAPVEPQPIVIENNSIEKLKISSAVLTGTAADCFVLTGTSGGRVSPGTSESKTWAVAPKDGLKSGIYYAAAELTFDNSAKAEIPIVFTVR